MKRTNLIAVAVAALTLAAAGEASAQWNNRPIEFGSGGRGEIGMSFGYRQTIIENELNGVEPENLVRNEFGAVMDLQEGPGHLAIVRAPVGTIVPQGPAGFEVGSGATGFGYGGTTEMASIADGGGSYVVLGGYDNAAVIAGWVAMVEKPDGGVGYLPAGVSPVDTWVAQASSLPPLVHFESQ